MVYISSLINRFSYFYYCFVLFEPLHAVNNFSVILGPLPGFNQYKATGMKCHAQEHNTVPIIYL